MKSKLELCEDVKLKDPRNRVCSALLWCAMCAPAPSRRLVLNGLTAEVGPPATTLASVPATGSPDSLEFYHELELYRQLLALPDAEPEPAPVHPPQRRAVTPDPTVERKRGNKSF